MEVKGASSPELSINSYIRTPRVTTCIYLPTHISKSPSSLPPPPPPLCVLIKEISGDFLKISSQCTKKKREESRRARLKMPTAPRSVLVLVTMCWKRASRHVLLTNVPFGTWQQRWRWAAAHRGWSAFLQAEPEEGDQGCTKPDASSFPCWPWPCSHSLPGKPDCNFCSCMNSNLWNWICLQTIVLELCNRSVFKRTRRGLTQHFQMLSNDCQGTQNACTTC